MIPPTMPSATSQQRPRLHVGDEPPCGAGRRGGRARTAAPSRRRRPAAPRRARSRCCCWADFESPSKSQQVGAEERRRDRAEHQPPHQPQVDRAGAQVHAGADRAHHHCRDEVGGDRRRRLDAEQQDQHRRHQRAAACAGHADEQPDDRAPENDVGIDVHQCFGLGVLGDRLAPRPRIVRRAWRSRRLTSAGRSSGAMWPVSGRTIRPSRLGSMLGDLARMRRRRQPVVLAADHQRRHGDALERVVQLELGHRDPDAGARVGRGRRSASARRRRSAPVSLRARTRCSGSPRGWRASRCAASGARAPRKPWTASALLTALANPGSGNNRCSAIRSPTPVLIIAAGEHPLRDVVVLGPCGDRHRAERVAGDDRSPALGHAAVQHRLEILAEARDRVVAVGRRLAVAVPAQVVGDDAESLPGEVPDHVGPEVERLGPAVREHQRGAVLGPEHLGVQHRAVGGANAQRTALTEGRVSARSRGRSRCAACGGAAARRRRLRRRPDAAAPAPVQIQRLGQLPASGAQRLQVA